MTARTTACVVAVVLAAALVHAPAHGQTAPGPPAPRGPRAEAPPGPPPPGSAPGSERARAGAVPTFALRVGGPLAVSASAGLIAGRVSGGGEACLTAVGVLAQGEAGLGGGKVSLGPALSYCHTPFGALGAAALKASLVRTWGSPLGAETGRSYLGPEVDIGVIDWKLSLGVLFRLGDPPGGRVLLTWGLGRGF